MTNTPAYYDADTCDIGDFSALIDQSLQAEDVPHASDIQKNVPIYDMADLRDALLNADARRALMAEWAAVLHRGAGVVALRNTYTNTAVLDQATHVYQDIIAQEKQANGGGADHFATAGAQ